MNKDNIWNMVIGVLSAILIGGGAYMMMTGGLIKLGGSDVEATSSRGAVEIENVDAEEMAETEAPAKAEEKTILKDVANKYKTMIKDGVTIEIRKEGTGDGIQSGQTAVVHYTGMFTDGKVFDSSIPRGEAFPVQLGAGMVIKGWETGLLGMKKGEQRRLTIPPEMGYGVNGAAGIIPPNATLVFDVELMEIK